MNKVDYNSSGSISSSLSSSQCVRVLRCATTDRLGLVLYSVDRLSWGFQFHVPKFHARDHLYVVCDAFLCDPQLQVIPLTLTLGNSLPLPFRLLCDPQLQAVAKVVMCSRGAQPLRHIGGGRGQWLGGTVASAEHEPITGVWGQSPQRGPGAEPLKLKAFLVIGCPTEPANLAPASVFLL